MKLPNVYGKMYVIIAVFFIFIVCTFVLISVGQTEQQRETVLFPRLPYDISGLEPYISAETIDFHYGKHHRGYVTKANRFIQGTPYENMPVEEIIVATAGRKDLENIFNNVAQAWNHAFYWQSMKPEGGKIPTGEILQAINDSFGSYDAFRQDFYNAAQGLFGSGWVWLVQDDGGLKIVETSDADNPIVDGLTPLIVIDVWEHAYYLDRQNKRSDYINAYLDNLVNWEFAASNFKR